MSRKYIYVLILMFAAPLRSEAQYAGTTHVIPIVADGGGATAGFYATEFFITKTDSAATLCTLDARGGLPSNRLFSSTMNFAGYAGFHTATTLKAGDPLVTGFVSIACNANVSVHALYTFFAGNGDLNAMTTVFSQGKFKSASLQAYQGPPDIRLGVAIANDTTLPITYSIEANVDGDLIGRSFTIAGQSSSARFLDELLTLPPGLHSVMVYIRSEQPLAATGLMYRGKTLTTVPLVIYF